MHSSAAPASTAANAAAGDDFIALAQAVIVMLGDSVRRRAMGDAGRARFEEHFTFAIFRERLDTLMRRAFPPRANA